ncbi:hypothetical protein SARC_11818, partial [Sphaeroforma arctica JP610]
LEPVEKPYDGIAQSVLAGFARWDGVYFTRIALYGYEYEQFNAFFPGVPMAIRAVSSTVLAPARGYISQYWIAVLAGLLIANCCFVAAADYLYRLAILLTKDEVIAFRSVVMFIVNPASVFMSSVYTESPFALTTFAGLYYLEGSHFLLSGLCFALGSGIRGNGIVNAGFLLYAIGTEFYNRRYFRLIGLSPCFLEVNSISKTDGTSCTTNTLADSKDENTKLGREGTVNRRKSLTRLTLACATTLLPFALFQYHGYYQQCVLHQTPSPYCTQDTTLLLYSFIQKHYWNNGFLTFWEWKQVPNIALATPLAALCCGLVYTYTAHVRGHLQVTHANTAEDKTNTTYIQRLTHYMLRRDDPARRVSISVCTATPMDWRASPRLCVYVAHLAFLVAFALGFMYVHCITRFIAASTPVVYILVAQSRDWADVWVAYGLVYSVLGACLFPNFYPWT